MIRLVAASPVDVLTYHYDLARTGLNPNETALRPDNVNSNDFGLLFVQPVDGFLYAQPLYMTNLVIPGKGTHNVVFAATEHNSVYAFDADTDVGENAAPLWQMSFSDPASALTAVPISDWGLSDRPATELGITGTPVIDRSSQTLYVVAWFKDGSGVRNRYYHQLYALDAATGTNKPGSPVVISATVPGTGAGTDGNGNVTFQSFYQLQRTGLLLLNGVVHITFASVGDIGPYHGWVLGYDAKTLNQVYAYNDTPNANQGGIWMSGCAPAADSNGNIFLATGNGTFDAVFGGQDYGDSVVKFSFNGSALVPTDYFTPFDQAVLNGDDGDLGSGGVMLLPDEVGRKDHPHLMVAGGKGSALYLVDRDNLGQYNSFNNSQIVQFIQPADPILGSPAYFNHTIYFGGQSGFLRAYSINNAAMQQTSQSSRNFGVPGPTPTVSANGNTNGIVWIIQADHFNASFPAILRAYDATDLSRELYSSDTDPNAGEMGYSMKFSTPIVSNGRVYVGTGNGIAVFGLLHNKTTVPPQLTINPDRTITVSGEAGQTYIVEVTTELGAAPAWQTLGTITLTGASVLVEDPYSTRLDTRYYRGIPAP